MKLSPQEQRILAGIEAQLGRNDPALTSTFTTNRLPSPRRWFPLTGVHTALLVVVLILLIVAHPVALAIGTGGVGLLTVALVVPWLVVVARSDADAPIRTRRRARRNTLITAPE